MLAVAAALFVLLPMWNFHRRGVQKMARREHANLLIFQERMAELEAERAAGTLEDENFQALKRELERSLLSDVTAAREKVEASVEAHPGFFTRARVIPLVMVAFIVPVSIGLYQQWGFEDELELASLFERSAEVSDDPQAIRDLIFSEIGPFIQRDNQNGWAMYLMGQNLVNMGLFAEASLSLGNAAALIEQPQDKVSILGQQAFLEFMLAEQVITDKVQGIIDQAQLIDPNQFLILQVQALDAERRQDHQAAITFWRRIAQQTPAGPEMDEINARIASAQQALAGGGEPAAVPEPTGAQVQVQVSLADGLALPAGTRVFISALEVNGRGQPLAARVLNVEDLPVTLTLSDADAVGPFNMSSAENIYVVATASSSGTANVQSGDYQARSDGFARADAPALVPLVIADRVP